MSNKNAIRFVQSVAALSNPSVSVDGIVGPMTRKAVSSFSKKEANSVNILLVDNGFPKVDKLVEQPKPVRTKESKKFGTDWQEFVRAAYRVVPQYSFDPEWIIAQAALETGWGERVPAYPDGRSSYNFGGIKSNSARQPKSPVTTKTREVINGRTVVVDANWAVYGSAEAYIHGYFDYVLNLSDRYRKPRNRIGNLRDAKTRDQYFSILKAGGYATDTDYVSKMPSMVSSVRTRYPKEVWA